MRARGWRRLGTLGFGLVLAYGFPSAAWAADFDGTVPLICAPVEVMDCIPGAPCFAGTPDQLGAPSFLRIDFAGKRVVGPYAEARIATVTAGDGRLLLQGVEIGHAFAIALDQETGRMTATLNDASGAFVLFGSCTRD